MMKILYVLNIGFDKGGPSVHLLKSVIESALDRGHECHVILKKTSESPENGLEELSERYSALKISLINDIRKGKSGFVKRYLEDCLYATKCSKKYARNAYDAIFLQSCNVGWVFMNGLRRLKCPIVFNVQDIFPQNLMFSDQLPLSKITYPLFSRLQMAAYNSAARIITISEDMKDTLAQQGVSLEKIDVVYNWSYADDPIRLENMTKDQIFDLGADRDKINVVYAGNIGKMQNVEFIAKTAKLSEGDASIHYYIIGDGANKSGIETMVERMTNVTLLPMQKSVYAESIYAQADINVIPLARGGIKTALPSKTATVMRTDSWVVFCIDGNSKFEDTVKGISRVRVADNSSPEALYRVICELRKENISINPEEQECVSIFSKRNSVRYVEIIESSTGCKQI